MNARRHLRRISLALGVLGATLAVDLWLPGGLVCGEAEAVVVEGTTLQQCGGTYYQPSGSQYEVVNVE